MSDPRIRCVQFTGSIPSGRLVGEACGAQLKPMLLELGGRSYYKPIVYFITNHLSTTGSNCAIVFADANLSQTVTQLVKGITFLNGQWCMGVGRIIVEKSIYDTFLPMLLSALKEVKVGRSSDRETEANSLGPLAFEEHCTALKGIIATLVSSGGVAHTSAEVPRDNSCYMSPTIISSASHSLCTEHELFGPLATYHSFTNIEEVIGMRILLDVEIFYSCY